METIKIAEGIALNIIETDSFKTNYLSFNFVTPLTKDSVSLNALLPQVLIRGTKKHKDLAEIKNALDDLYAASVEGRVYRRGDNQICGMAASWLSDRYSIDGTKITDGTLDIIYELLFEPLTENGVFLEKYVESEKRILIDDIRAAINNKTSYAIKRCQQEMCKNEAYGLGEYGEEAWVEKISAKDLFEAYEKLLKNARIEIFYVGSDNKEILSKRIAKMFEGLKREYKELEPSKVIRNVEKVKEITEKCPVAQGKLSLGFRMGTVFGEDDYRALPVFIEMYGNSPVSKLFMNVREKLSLCYYCRAIPEGTKGIMIVTSGIEVANRQKTQDEILAQLESVKSGDFTEEELVLAKKSLKNAYSELNDSPASLEGWYLTRRLVGLSDTPESVCDGFMKVTAADVIRVSNKLKLDTVYFLEGTLEGEADYDEE
ncbi:MAG: insulinase family protein [Clostridia bacterium]|nr:insulinase family protein [Clostridia bacterium]